MRQQKIEEILKKTTNYSHYNGWSNRTLFGYHSYYIDEISVQGQRNNLMRIAEFEKHIDFKNKNVVDFWCNVGAILHHLKDIKQGVGFDYDKVCISSANKISSILKIDNLKFYVHDFDKNKYESLKNKITFNPDVIFLLSLGSWVKSWKTLYDTALSYNAKIVLEINNEKEGVPQLAFFKNKKVNIDLIIEDLNDDSLGNKLRKTYLIYKK